MSRMPSYFAPSSARKEVFSYVTPSSTVIPSTATAGVTLTKETELPPQSKKRIKSQATLEKESRKKQLTTTIQPSPTSIGSVFGRLAEKNVTEEEFKMWKGHTEAEQNDAIARATNELFFHNLTREENKQALETRIEELKVDKKNSDKKIKELESKLQKVQDGRSTLESSLSSLKEEKTRLEKALEGKDVYVKSVEDKNVVLSSKVEKLEADKANGWAEEKESLKEESYTEGFRGYLKSFMAADPGYNWADKFGEVMASWMREFAVIEASAIAERRAALALEREREKELPTITETHAGDIEVSHADDEEAS